MCIRDRSRDGRPTADAVRGGVMDTSGTSWVRRGAVVVSVTLALASAAALAACGGTGGSSPAPSSPTPAVYTAADDGATVAASVGEQFTVSLEENPTTGYEWDMKAGPGLTLVGDEFVGPSPSPSPLMVLSLIHISEPTRLGMIS